MATLVLTAVGGAVGGPIGAALGAALGRTVDASLFAPKGRQGPRLTELAVQTSSYATQIPRLFGTMRVAGSVIWAIDLVEARSSDGAGKGQPSVTSYSYSANFAVLLSGRPILGVRRIWADGKLLRGAAGDWKTQTGFRLYLGGEDEQPDPLIAAAEGMAHTPAHRGCAYAVFEGLQLADFGNRIPSLTFEVEADAGAVALGGIVEEVSGRAITQGEASLPLIGYSAQGDSIRAAVEGLLSPAGYWIGSDGIRGEPGAACPIEDAAARAAGEDGGRGMRTIAASDRAPAEVTIGYYDAAREYQTGVQRAVRASSSGRAQRIELPAVLEAAQARALAERAVEALDLQRETRRVSLDWRHAAIVPGDRVVLTGEAGQWRVSSATLDRMVVVLDLHRIGSAALSPRNASSGRVSPASDAVHGPTLIAGFELPPLAGAGAVPQVAILAAGLLPGWRRAALLASEDDGQSWQAIGGTAAPAVLGTLTGLAERVPATLEDRRSVMEVEFAHDEAALAGADAAALDLGANLALVGDELLQFGGATQVAPRRWRLRRLWRGRRGTEAAIGTQQIGDGFALIEADAIRWFEPRRIGAGVHLRVRAVGIAGDAEGASTEVPATGWSLCPPSPVHIAADMQAGAIELRWVRRSRDGWWWRDGVEVPLAEDAEAYSVRLFGVDGSLGDFLSAAPHIRIPADGIATRPVRIEVRQIGTHGVSAPGVLPLS
ncbi:phage tail protein [Sphingomonas sp. PL-96]|uniref:phage tail protein n=1 Tax=Sphingomonas sp. PL-96 TaxID=2887201 RepID=UPI001E5A6D61|nr:phage tail protein [Sphingomonas sp. PL-96]MCC2977400.1 phage tail protein [Sphingomonas sp. PL-96]